MAELSPKRVFRRAGRRKPCAAGAVAAVCVGVAEPGWAGGPANPTSPSVPPAANHVTFPQLATPTSAPA